MGKLPEKLRIEFEVTQCFTLDVETLLNDRDVKTEWQDYIDDDDNDIDEHDLASFILDHLYAYGTDLPGLNWDRDEGRMWDIFRDNGRRL